MSFRWLTHFKISQSAKYSIIYFSKPKTPSLLQGWEMISGWSSSLLSVRHFCSIISIPRPRAVLGSAQSTAASCLEGLGWVGSWIKIVNFTWMKSSHVLLIDCGYKEKYCLIGTCLCRLSVCCLGHGYLTLHWDWAGSVGVYLCISWSSAVKVPAGERTLQHLHE